MFWRRFMICKAFPRSQVARTGEAMQTYLLVGSVYIVIKADRDPA